MTDLESGGVQRVFRWSPHPRKHYMNGGSGAAWLAKLSDLAWNIVWLSAGDGDVGSSAASAGYRQAVKSSLPAQFSLADRHFTLESAAHMPATTFVQALPHAKWAAGKPPQLLSWSADWVDRWTHRAYNDARGDHPFWLNNTMESKASDVSAASAVLLRIKENSRHT